MEEIVPVCSKVEAGGTGAFRGSRQKADKCHREEQWCAQELARTWSQQGTAEGRVQKGGSEASQGHSLHPDNRFQQSISGLKHEHRENRQNTASLATGVRAARPTRTPATLHGRPSKAPRTLRRTWTCHEQKLEGSNTVRPSALPLLGFSYNIIHKYYTNI